MTEQRIEEILTSGNPWRTPEDSAMSIAIAETATLARRASRRRPRRRLTWIAPVAAVGALALTAGAVVVSDSLVREELLIPISYTTQSGDTVDCVAQITGGSLFTPFREEVIDYYRTHDFDGVGQRIYDYALVLTGDRKAAPGVLPESSEWIPAEGERYADAQAFSFSLTSFLLTDTGIALGLSGSGGAELTSDCTGRLR
ncbi:hypothetical protein [Microbacterium tumbae]